MTLGAELGYIEQWGSGVGRIRSACENVGLPTPTITEKGDSVDVELYRIVPDGTGKVADSSGKVADSSGKVADSSGKVADGEQKILEYLEKHGRITTQNVMELTGLQKARARRILQGMTEQGIIAKQGSGPATYYTKV